MHPVLFYFGEITVAGREIPIAIGSYGLAYAIALLVGYAFFWTLLRRHYPNAPATDIYFGSIIVGEIGSRLANVLIFLPDLLDGRRTFLGVLTGGGVYLAGVIAGVGFLLLMVRIHELDFGRVTNIVFLAIPLAHAIGRLGCLLGGCCFGAECSLPWAITYHDPLAHQLNGTPIGVPLHPTPIYEMIAELANFALLWWIYHRGAPRWSLMTLWLGLYGIERFFIEFFRADPRGVALLSTSQWVSLGMIASSLALWLLLFRWPRSRSAAV
jgi:phosphatidylglycerol:prolipoprotein diacylglycerol transferase